MRRLRLLLFVAVCAVVCAALAACTSDDGHHGAATSSLVASDRCHRNQAAGTIHYISPFGFDASASILDVFVAQKLGYFRDLCLDVQINSSATNGSQLVSSGRAQLTGLGSAADQLAADATGADLVGIATFANTTPYTVLTGTKITSLTQLAGRTLGYHNTLPVAVQAMLHAARVDLGRVKQVRLTSYDPTQVTRGVVDAVSGYASNEPVQLRERGVKFRQFDPATYGVRGTYNVLSANAAYLRAHRGAVSDWLRADLKAAQYCLDHQSACVRIMTDYAKAAHADKQFPYAHNLAVWKLEAGLIAKHNLGRGLGVQTTAEWRPELDQLTRYVHPRTVPSLARAMDPDLAAGLYANGRLRWPG